MPEIPRSRFRAVTHRGFPPTGPGLADSRPVQWKPHALASPQTEQLDLDRGDRVEAAVDLPGVPAGTQGKVILANGFNWLRYRVRFDTGAELGDLDGHHLRPVGRTARRLAKRAAKRR